MNAQTVEAVPFNRQPKIQIGAMIPVKVDELLRKEVDRSGRSISLLASFYLCRGLGLDPTEFGIYFETD
ncbi:MAG: hypothetical protein KGL39_27350 [Patescibacteria group bacterium]|nr:hypothetical protein [Patescibacteria group bacterium]